MDVDVLFDPFGGRWSDLGRAAALAEESGFDGVWLYDHLAGSAHGADDVLECWTVLTAIAATVPRIAVGPLVLNVANRSAGTLAVMAATLQEVSGGRLLLGMGAGGSRRTPYAAEQEALGRSVGGSLTRRTQLEEHIGAVRQAWTGTVGDLSGFLRPEPPPPIIIGGFGPKMAELAGRLGDGINVPAGPNLDQLIDLARTAHARSGRDPTAFIVTVSANTSAPARERLLELGVDRHIVSIGAPYVGGVRRAAEALHR